MVVLSKPFAAILAIASTVRAQLLRPNEMKARGRAPRTLVKRDRTPTLSYTTHVRRPPAQNITFAHPNASGFWVDGSSIPLVPFDVGNSWAGLLPISKKTDETRQLFFWFFPGAEGSTDDITVWLNGGPGCSSLTGLLWENGPFKWLPGQSTPSINEYSWTHLTSMIWVDQPVGTGFSQGTPDIADENQLAEQFVGFLQQFLEVFSELRGKRLWLAGESYAGMYIPYIANYIYENPGTLCLTLEGVYMIDPLISCSVTQNQIGAVDFVHKHESVFSFNQTYLKYLDEKNVACNYSDYAATYGTYPPRGPLPLPGGDPYFADNCDLWDDIYNNSILLNSAFNVYHILDTPPILQNVIDSEPTSPNTQSPIYFKRADVKKALHVPADTDWQACTSGNVFPDGDASLPSSFTVLPSVIEKNKRTLIAQGMLDFLLNQGGVRLAIQNTTWGGLQGFQTPIITDGFILDGVGSFGNLHSERGLTYVEVALAGHMVPQYQPQAAFQLLQYLLGLRETP